jgi:hypothetical protein
MTVGNAIVVGRLIAKVVRREFESAGMSADSPPAIRLAGFSEDEIRELIDVLAGWVVPGYDDKVQIVVGSQHLEGLDEYLLPADRTLTAYRNTNTSGLVLIELDAQSDEQGLKQMHSVADSDLLDGDSATIRLRWLFELAWGLASGMAVPDTLVTEARALFEWVIPSGRPSLRQWVAFAVDTSTNLAAGHRAVSGDETRRALANGLSRIGLFPDDLLFERRTAAPRRLERNHHLAELRSPQGRELRDDDLASSIDAVKFIGVSGEELSEPEMSMLRQRMHDVLAAGGPSATISVQLAMWEQLFEKKSTKAGVGDLIREFLTREYPGRLDEFDDLNLDEGLNNGEADAAETLLNASPVGDEAVLADLLPSAIRKKVDRLVFRGEYSASDPLIAVLNGLKAMSPDEYSDDVVVALSWDRFGTGGRHSSRLFGFLYGNTLAEVQEASNGGLGVRLEVSAELLETGSISTVFDEIKASEEREQDEDEEDAWGPLQLVLRSSNSKTPLIRFRWSPQELPGLVVFARLVMAGGATLPLSTPPLEEWASNTLASWEDLGHASEEQRKGPTGRWSSIASRYFEDWTKNGLSANGVGDFLDEWRPVLDDARSTLIPSGGPLDALTSFLECDTAKTSDGHLIILATHPLRLRWFGDHLRHLGKFLMRALEGGLQLNAENDQLYFDWLDQVSPHRQPPLVAEARKLYTSIREFDMHEEYAPVGAGSDGLPEWLTGLDSASIDEMAATVRSFVTAFPYKNSGLSVLLLSQTGADQVARRLVNSLRKRELAGMDLELHVLTPARDHSAVALAMEPFDSDEGRGRRLLPSFRLVLHDWIGDPTAVLDELVGRIDVALAPNLFGLHTTPIPETRRREAGLGGFFNPWIDASSHGRPPQTGTINVSEVLLPGTPDPVLEGWSTLAVRRYNQSPLNADDPDGTDFFTLQVQFDKNEDLFAKLHEVAHWVVTLDQFIGRDQIDALSNAPDVITVRPGIGQNQIYTMVVSSTAGRAWVTARLAMRLQKGFGFDPEPAKALAQRLYEIGRQVAPGLMLRAVGLGRTVEEILGLILARFAIAVEDGAPPTEAVEYWVTLDDHIDWFGGANRVRPDLLRMRIQPGEAGQTEVEVLVLESKFRQAFATGMADDQVGRAVRLLRDALGSDETRQFDDVEFWRREILGALDQLPHTAAEACDLPSSMKFGDATDEKKLRAKFRDGEYRVRDVTGIVCVTTWDAQAPTSEAMSTVGGHRLIRIDAARAKAILGRLDRRDDPYSTALQVETVGIARVTAATSNDEPATSPGRTTADDFRPASGEIGITPPLLRHQLDPEVVEQRLQRIIDRLDTLGVKVSAPENEPFREGPGFCSYRVLPNVGVSTQSITGKLEDLKLALELPAAMSIRAYVDRGAVVFEVPKDDDDRYFVDSATLLADVPDDPDVLSVPLGEDIQGKPVVLDFSSSDTPHLLVAGQTGSGKSVALEAMLRGLCERKPPSRLELLLVDGKGTELTDFESEPHVRGVIGWQPEDAIAVLEEAVKEMARRYQLFKQLRAKSLVQYNGAIGSEQLPWWLVVLDEYADLTSDPDERKQIEALLKRLAQKGRSAGIHCIVATQKPSAEVLSTVIRSNLPAQLALRVKTASDSRVILDEAGAESLAGKGDAFLKTAKGMTRIQCARVDPQQL